MSKSYTDLMNLMEKNLLALKYEMALSCSVGKTFASLVTQTYEGSIFFFQFFFPGKGMAVEPRQHL